MERKKKKVKIKHPKRILIMRVTSTQRIWKPKYSSAGLSATYWENLKRTDLWLLPCDIKTSKVLKNNQKCELLNNFIVSVLNQIHWLDAYQTFPKCQLNTVPANKNEVFDIPNISDENKFTAVDKIANIIIVNLLLDGAKALMKSVVTVFNTIAKKSSQAHKLKIPGFLDQADHSLTIVWRHTNHTKFRTWSCHDQLGNHIWSRNIYL